MRRHLFALSLLCSLPFAAQAASPSYDFGQPGEAAKADRTVEIKLGDMFFEPESLEVKAGETVRFVVKNEGSLLHEFNLGRAAMHAEHQQHMQQMMDSGALNSTGMNHGMQGMDHSQMGHADMNPGGMNQGGMMKMHHDGNSVLVEPGKTAELTWTFGSATELEFACNMPGHYQAGMVGKMKVAP